MKIRQTVLGLNLTGVLLLGCAAGAWAQEEAPAPRLKIGVYDSRGVAIAWARSSEFNAGLAKMRADLQEAQARGDEATAKKLEEEGQAMQVRLHLRGFSTAGAGDLLAKVADRLPEIAREAGVALIVSKWELPYRDPGITVVDVTVPVARLFNPDEQTIEILGALEANPPVPLDEISLDAND